MPDIKQEILVVDDEPSGVEAVADFLSIEGYQPLVCTHPQEVLATFEKDRFCLGFVDINLPDMSGLELASKLKEIDPRIEIVFMTGYGTFDNAVEAIKIGAYDYLRKPFGINELSLCLRRFQERQALTERLEHSERRYFSLVQSIPTIIFVIKERVWAGYLCLLAKAIEGRFFHFPADCSDRWAVSYMNLEFPKGLTLPPNIYPSERYQILHIVLSRRCCRHQRKPRPWYFICHGQNGSIAMRFLKPDFS